MNTTPQFSRRHVRRRNEKRPIHIPNPGPAHQALRPPRTLEALLLSFGVTSKTHNPDYDDPEILRDVARAQTEYLADCLQTRTGRTYLTDFFDFSMVDQPCFIAAVNVDPSEIPKSVASRIDDATTRMVLSQMLNLHIPARHADDTFVPHLHDGDVLYLHNHDDSGRRLFTKITVRATTPVESDDSIPTEPSNTTTPVKPSSTP